MSTYQDSAYAGTAPAAPAKPLTVTLTMWLSLAVGLLGLIGGIVMITGGHASIRKFVDGTFGDTLGSADGSALLDAVLADAYNKLVVKAVIGIVASLLVVLFAFLARNAATGPRIGLVIVLFVGMGAASGLQLGDREVLPSASIIIAAITPLLGLIAIVLALLPASKRYANARKGA